MLNKFLTVLFALILFQVIYFIVKSLKDRYRQGNTYILGTAYVRGLIAVLLLVILMIFVLI